MKILGKLLFYAVVALLWVFIIAASLEGWARWRWHRIETSNPFVLSRTQHQLWPIPRIPENEFSAEVTNTELRDRYRGQGKSREQLQAPTPEEEVVRRFEAFLAQDEFGRYVFANVYGLNILSLDAGGGLLKAFASPEMRLGDTSADKYVYAADLEPVMQALREAAAAPGAPRFLPSSNPGHLGPFGYCVMSSPPSLPGKEPEAPLWLLMPREESWRPPEVDTIWELPFFTYQKHVERKERVSALGITEHFQMNNYGFRDADIIMPKPEGVFRILCVGASTTEEGPVNDLTYPAILEMLLNKRFGFNRIDVVNCGISGMNSLKHRMKMADYLALEPDLIVIYNAVNDICHDLFPLWIKNASPLQKRLRESRFACRYFGRYLIPGEAQLRADIQNSKISNIAFISRYARERGVDVAICSFAAPDPKRLTRAERDYYEYYSVLEWTGRYSNFDSYIYSLGMYNEALKRLCDDERLLYIPVWENMRDGAVIFGDICHLRNPGIEKKAGIIAEALAPRIAEALNIQAP